MTLIDKLEKKATQYLQYKVDSKTLYDFRYFGGNANGFTEAIDIVKKHSEWISTNERLPYAEEMLTNHYDPKEFYEIILKTGELLITSFTHMKNDGNNEMLFLDCNIALTDGEWKLLDGGFTVYEVYEVAYWKPIKAPREV